MTRMERNTYLFIIEFFNTHQYAPTTSEIAAGIGIQSRGVVHRYLKSLQRMGKIMLTPHRHRNITLTDQSLLQPDSVPLLGKIAAGQPIEAVLDHERIDIKTLFGCSDVFALRVNGDSMQEEGILDQDIIVCQSTEQAQNGDIVIALIEQHTATLKRYFRGPKNNTITLEPANQNYPPVTYNEEQITIQGKYIGLIRGI